VAYVARLVLYRYAMLGVLDETGEPVNAMGVLAAPADAAGTADTASSAPAASAAAGKAATKPMAGKPCPECGNATMIHKDGCDFCTSCGYVGACG